MALPPLRQELSLLPGPALLDGQPSHTLHDPVRNVYFQLDWPTFEILSRWMMSDPAHIIQDIEQHTTLTITEDDLIAVAEFLAQNELLQVQPGQAGKMAGHLQKLSGNWWQWLLHHYLFFRVPLVKPDRLITRLERYTRFVFTPWFALATLLALLFGVVQIYRGWDSFSSTLLDQFSIKGVLGYGLTLILVKVLHELGHATTAKRFGCKIPTMGVAFLVMLPVAYTDTNDVWRLTSKQQRLAVAGAGILTELMIAIWAGFLWYWLPDGLARSIAFMLATTTWVATVLINASPFMRFDGYFLLSDFLGLPNLHTRAFALARWHLREVLFGIHAPKPEAFSAARERRLILFAWATWIYRLSLFIGIAFLVYTFFIKLLGILLFLVEVMWFIWRPFKLEFKVWRELWPAIRQGKHTRRTMILASGIVLALLMPWQASVTSSGLLRPQQYEVIYAPKHSRLAHKFLPDDAVVRAGQPLLQLDSPELAFNMASSEAKLQALQTLVAVSGFSEEQKKQLQGMQGQVLAAMSEQLAQRDIKEKMLRVAPFSGRFRWINPDIREGEWLSESEPLALMIGQGGYQVTMMLPEDDVVQLVKGDEGRFYPESAPLQSVSLKVASIAEEPVHYLQEPLLASQHGGSLLVREKNNVLVSDVALYQVTLTATDMPKDLLMHGWRGKVVVHGRSRIPVVSWVRHAVAVFWREAGF
ncbi:site-2 protease family protein [Leeia oryzae]|uniref:site-2 protease family protein n=1 Tax=Leeia oryzae TaxID=356662 RepID=UPI00035CD265|nr:site-2 protease family protein [Leeia oryzae]